MNDLLAWGCARTSQQTCREEMAFIGNASEPSRSSWLVSFVDFAHNAR